MIQEPTNPVTMSNEAVGIKSIETINYGVQWRNSLQTWENAYKTWDESTDSVILNNI